ncbi:metallophosphoesterase [Siccirubricoccus phaeus]|uniref:metallophosphoesterase n=1 Tax=Siccirubricoccus phaeus TaxID=2595053 RepID=UPI001F27255E|nr:metallophosphoesterase [Siccirubricoccus phaeus]
MPRRTLLLPDALPCRRRRSRGVPRRALLLPDALPCRRRRSRGVPRRALLLLDTLPCRRRRSRGVPRRTLLLPDALPCRHRPPACRARGGGVTPDPALADLRRRGFRGLRVVGDVHGEAASFAHAVEAAAALDLFLLQLGDLTDHGPDSPGVLRLMFGLLDAGRGRFLLGNHDHKLRRALLGHKVKVQPEGLGRTLAQLEAVPDGAALAARAIAEIAAAPAWLRLDHWLFVHGGWHPAMLRQPAPPGAGAGKPDPLLSRALFGQVTGRMLPDGFPERLHGWVNQIPAGFTLYCGHDRRSADGRPYEVAGAAGGRAVFLDTGAGKGGHLSWVDLAFPG